MRTERQRCSQRGFALVIALSLMAFVVTLLLSMTLLIRVETGNTEQQLAQLRAKEAARLAVMVALGNLQKHAGPDQRVTARADIVGTTVQDSSRFWTGVWDTSETDPTAVWLVSGDNPLPTSVYTNLATMSEDYDAANDGDYSTAEDSPAVRAPFEPAGDNIEIAWWIVDEGVKAPLQPVDGFTASTVDPVADETYLDYNRSTILNNRIQQDTYFDFPDLYDSSEDTSSEEDILRRSNELAQLSFITKDLDEDERNKVEGELLHTSTLNSYFVLSNTLDGGLKGDLSYLKTVNTDSLTSSDLQSNYDDPDNLLSPQIARLIQSRANPTVLLTDDVSGMRLDATTITQAESESVQYRLAPVITEFQLSLGVAADDQGASRSTETDSPLYVVHKLYLEVWNPYTVPFRIGDSAMAPNQGYSDLRVEIENLPSFTITNSDSGTSVSGTIPTLTYLWSDYSNPQTLRPGMVYQKTLPQDNYEPEAANEAGKKNGTGIELEDLSLSLSGTSGDTYSGSFTYPGSPVTITVYALDSSSNEVELFRAEISGYNAFGINYDPSNRATYFKRRITSASGQFGMNHDSLETQGYAFAVRFKMLDEQELPGPIQDISNWLSLYDVRKQSLEVDLSSWDINDAWTSDPPMPYDFRLNAIDTDPAFFEPSESFNPDDFFHYGASSGRRDRVARLIDYPTGEVMEMGALRSLQFRDFSMGAVGNPFGGNLNRLYDRYFFSTLPNPSVSTWDGESELGNPRIIAYSEPPALDTADTAEELIVENGFNLNSSSELAWQKILSGNTVPASTLQARYEQGAFPDPPEIFTIPNALKNAYINHPQTAVFNLTEEASSPEYSLLIEEETSDYIDEFSINSIDWQNNLQHPAFIQPIRELSQTDTDQLAASIVSALKDFYTTNDRPPLSISEYLESGILQNAIDNSPGINNRSSDQDQIPTHAPSSITQATLMNYLGTFAFSRSDTFKVRGLAKYTNPFSQDSTTAACEMLVQRLPDEHPQAELGRRFQILDFQWLTDNF